jgi:O-antigen/teichoic acid export membrane protein
MWRILTFFLEVSILWYIIPYKPKFVWNSVILKQVVSFGLPLLGGSVLIYYYWNIDYFIIGKLLVRSSLVIIG